MIAGLNLNALASNALASITPTETVILLSYKRQKNNRGVISVDYDEIELQANVQSTKNPEIDNKDAVSIKRNFVKIFINSNANSLSRALSIANDFFIRNGIKYEIIRIDDNYSTGWVSCLCAETSESKNE